MKFSIRKNWLTSFELLINKPKIITPFLCLIFFEILALEFIYFFPRKPLMYVFNPIIQKYFGLAFVHYPRNFIILPKLFYYAQMLMYIFLGVVLSSITVNMVKKVAVGLPVKIRALLKNASSRYLSFLAYGVLVAALMFFMKKFDVLVFYKFTRLVSRYLPGGIMKFMPLALPLSLFIFTIVMNTLFILVVPIIVIKNASLIKALMESVYLGLRHFFTIFVMIVVPCLIYLPIILLNSFPIVVMNKSFPEAVGLITLLSIVVSLFLECFIIVCVSRFLLYKYKTVTVS